MQHFYNYTGLNHNYQRKHHASSNMPKEKVELFFSCKNLTNMDYFSLTDPQIRIFTIINGEELLLGETEVISDNLNPKFSKSITLDYIFEAKQHLHFQVVDLDEPDKRNLVGDVYTTLGTILGSRKQSASFQIMKNNKSCGELIVNAEKVGTEATWTGYFEIQGKDFENQHGWFLTSSPYFKLSKETTVGTDTVVTYESEAVRGNLNPKWDPFEISLQKLCNGDRTRPITLQVYTRRVFREVLIGQCTFTVEKLLSNKTSSFMIKRQGKTEACGRICIKRCDVFEKLSFLDYLKAGLQLNMTVAIDFTASNGFPDSSSSLHAISPYGYPNQYQEAIRGVGEILLCYDYDQMVSVYGFGGVPNGDKFGEASHCFSLTGNNENASVCGLGQVMELYQKVLQIIQFSGPTYFSKILLEGMMKAKNNKMNGSSEYVVLLILTDGVIHDMEQTINCLVEAAHLPLSVIIIGIGDANFGQMTELDGDKGLYNKSGVQVSRDLVQFVPFNKFKGNKEKLANEVLQEIPMQLARYMLNEKVSLLREKEEGNNDDTESEDEELYKYAPPISEMHKIMQTEDEKIEE